MDDFVIHHQTSPYTARQSSPFISQLSRHIHNKPLNLFALQLFDSKRMRPLSA